MLATSCPSSLRSRRIKPPSSRVSRRRSARPANRSTGQKLAPRVFGKKAAPHARKTLLLILILHRENSGAEWKLVLGCAVDPNYSANPTYNPQSWNDGGYRGDGKTIQGNSNCYAYACNQKGPFKGGYNPLGGDKGFGMQPGDKAGDPIRTAEDFTLEGIRKRAIEDGLSPTPVEGGYRVFLVFAPNDNPIDRDYHWYREDDNGLWSQKHGSNPVDNVDASGHLISDPTQANHNYPGLNYSQQGGYLWVPPGFHF